MAEDYCQELVRARDFDRFIASLFAPADRRSALFALYAFNVEISSVRERAREPMPGEVRLQWWREIVTGERKDETAANPVSSALLTAIVHYSLPREALVALVDAHSVDLYDEPMQSFEQLQRYSQETEGRVLSLASKILGAQGGFDIIEPAANALTLRNILTGIGQHRSIEHFVPTEAFTRDGAGREDLARRAATENVIDALKALSGRGLADLRKADAIVSTAAEIALPAFLPAAPLHATFKRLQRYASNPFRPQKLSRWRRQWLIWRAARDRKRIFG